MNYDRILIRYGELTTKGKNRNRFINLLLNNIKNILKEHQELTYEKTNDRMYIVLNGADYEEVGKKLKNVFGIYSFSYVVRIDSNFDTIKEAALAEILKLNVKTFKVETKRSDKQFPLDSMMISRKVGGYVLANTEHLKVDVHNPEALLQVEVRKDYSYVTTKTELGAGGYPVGIQGKGLLMLSGGIDSPVAGYLTMKRGVLIEGIHFASPPHTSERALEKVKKLTAKLCRYNDNIKLHVVPFTDLQLAIYQHVPSSYAITIMRRMMYRIAVGVAEKRNCLIITNGESIGQVASQTLESISVINKVVDIPVIRPVACLDKLEIIDIAKKIDTYDISIEPFEDCCTIFLPKNPVTHPSLEKVLEIESKFEWKHLVDECIANTEIVAIHAVQKDEFDSLF